jgi:hypothetical protein
MNEGSVYPPTGRWHELTRQEQRERIETSADLVTILQWNRGDARLTAWEESFLAGMVHQIQTFHGAAKISRKQWDKIHAILEKVEQPPEETEEEPAEIDG